MPLTVVPASANTLWKREACVTIADSSKIDVNDAVIKQYLGDLSGEPAGPFF